MVMEGEELGISGDVSEGVLFSFVALLARMKSSLLGAKSTVER
jgi:hypothetical protein